MLFSTWKLFILIFFHLGQTEVKLIQIAYHLLPVKLSQNIYYANPYSLQVSESIVF